jgi:hypothetical protein
LSRGGGDQLSRAQEIIRAKLSDYRDLILKEALGIKGFMALLMKGARVNWSEAETTEIRRHLVRLSKRIPALIVFLSPGGVLLLPVLVEILDRRKKKRAATEERRRDG